MGGVDWGLLCVHGTKGLDYLNPAKGRGGGVKSDTMGEQPELELWALPLVS